jgi:hypothetical protein
MNDVVIVEVPLLMIEEHNLICGQGLFLTNPRPELVGHSRDAIFRVILHSNELTLEYLNRMCGGVKTEIPSDPFTTIESISNNNIMQFIQVVSHT